MKRKLIAALAATTVLAMVFAGCGSSSSSSSSSSDSSSSEETTEAADTTAAEDVDFGLDMECDPDSNYEEYALVDYTIEDLGAEFVATVSKKGDDEYCIKCVFYGDDQEWEGTYDESAGTVVTTTDKTGFMEGDAPNIIQAAIDQGLWAPIQ